MNSSALNDLAGLIATMALKDRIQELIDAGFRKSELAKAAGKSPAAVTHWLNGETKEIKADSAAGLQALTGFSSIWISEGRGPKKINTFTAQSGVIPPDYKLNQPLTRAGIAPVAIDLDNNPEYPAVRRVNIKAQAGVSGYAVEYMHDDGPPIVFRADWYKSKGYRPERMLAVRVIGESMIPSLYQDDLIVVNTEQAQPKQGVPFLVSFEGEVVVKRLVRDEGMWWLVSDNPDQRRYPKTKCNGSTEIIGEVVYRQTERI